MSQHYNNCSEKQQPSDSDINLKASSAEPTKATNNTVTAAKYIYSTMIPPTKSSTPETAEVATLGKRERCNTGGSSKSGGPIMSMDLFLTSDDVALDGGLGALSSGDAIMTSLKSSDFVKDLIQPDLPDTAATAAAALKAEQPATTAMATVAANNEDAKPRSQQQEIDDDEDDFNPVIALTAQLERISTADEVAPLSENFRISSREWVKDLDSHDKDLGPMHPALFMGNPKNTDNRVAPPQSRSPAPSPAPVNYDEYQIPLAGSDDWLRVAEQFSTLNPVPPLKLSPTNNRTLRSSGHPPLPVPPLSNPTIVHNLPTTSPKSSATKNASPSSSTTSKKKKKKKRMIDESRSVEPTENDVLFGRGGFTNTHPGNIKFRQKALELRPWYEQCTTSKEEKYRISDLLVESVKCEGNRFLERGDDGLWHEVIGNGARKKASQALRERVRGSRKTGGASSATSPKLSSASRTGGGNFNVDELIGDIMPTDVTSDVVGV